MRWKYLTKLKSLTITSLADLNSCLCNHFPHVHRPAIEYLCFVPHTLIFSRLSQMRLSYFSQWNAAMQSTSLCRLKQVARLPHSVVVKMLICITMWASFLSCKKSVSPLISTLLAWPHPLRGKGLEGESQVLFGVTLRVFTPLRGYNWFHSLIKEEISSTFQWKISIFCVNTTIMCC